MAQVLDYEELEDGGAIVTMDFSEAEQRFLLELGFITLLKERVNEREPGSEELSEVQQSNSPEGQEEGE